MIVPGTLAMPGGRTVHLCPQRSPEWHALRVGMIGGSTASKILASRKDGKEAAARRDLKLQLACERITGVSQSDPFLNGLPGDMARGTALEPDGVSAYEVRTGSIVQQVGFVVVDGLPVGCSPDGVIGDLGSLEGFIEIKAPRAAIHLSYIRAGAVPPEYLPQLIHNLYVTGSPWADFVSWCPLLPEPLQLFVTRYVRRDGEIASYELALRQFLAEVDAEVNTVMAMAEKAAVA